MGGVARPLAVLALALAAGYRGLNGQQSLAGWRTDFSRRTRPLDEIVSGGPPKDGVPAIDHPRFESVAAADRWLARREPVVVVSEGLCGR